jgi:ATP-binding cassette subfamily F protein 3
VVAPGGDRGRRRERPRAGRAVRELRRRLEQVEAQINALEERLRGLGEALADPGLYGDGERVRAIAQERKSAEEQVAWLLREWEELSEAVAGHE